MIQTPDIDITIVGAGFSGSGLAIKANEMGLKVRVFDATEHYPNHFRAEKLEHDQYDALDKLDLLPLVEPKESSFIEEVIVYKGKSHTVKPQSQHRGMLYNDTVNSFRNELRKNDLLQVDTISHAEETPDGYLLTSKKGEVFNTRILVLATGFAGPLLNKLNIVNKPSAEMLSTSFGFHVDSLNPNGFPHRAFNYRPKKWGDGLDFVTFFPVGSHMRVNVFTSWPTKDERVGVVKKNTKEALEGFFPELIEQIGDYELSSKVQIFTTYFYQKDCENKKKLALIGDAFQAVSPATGLGLSKCLTDVQVLIDTLQVWSQDKSRVFDPAPYYADKRKLAVDKHAKDAWEWSNERCSSRSFSTLCKHFNKYLRSTALWKKAQQLKAAYKTG